MGTGSRILACLLLCGLALSGAQTAGENRMESLLDEIEQVTDELQRIYSLSDSEIEEQQDRINELTDRLTALETEAQGLSRTMETDQAAADTPGAPAESAAVDSGEVSSRQRIGRLVILGNDRTSSKLLRRTITVRKKRPYDKAVHDHSLLRLDRLHILYERRFILLPDTTEEGRTLFLRVSDIHGLWANPVDFLVKKGVEAADGRLSLTWHNIDGEGKNLTLGTEWEWWHWDKKQAAFLEYTVPFFFRWPLTTTFYLFDRKETWYSGLFEEDDVTVLGYGGGMRWSNLIARWLEGQAGLEYYQRTFNRTWADGDILSAWTRWDLTTRRIRPPGALNYGVGLLLDYNFYHPMGRFDDLGHYGRLWGAADIGTGLGRRVIATDRFTGGIASPGLPVDRCYHAGTETILRGHPKRALLGTALAHNMFELEILAHDRFSLVGFSDIGYVWPGWADVNPIDLEFDFGAGVIADLPWFGKVRFDYAFNPEYGTWKMYLKGL